MEENNKKTKMVLGAVLVGSTSVLKCNVNYQELPAGTKFNSFKMYNTSTESYQEKKLRRSKKKSQR